MELFRENNKLLKLFVEFFGGKSRRHDLSKERWAQIENDFGQSVYSDILYMLTQIDFESHEARKHFHNVLDHLNEMSDQLKRDVGFTVAMCDYFTNMHPIMDNLVFIDVQLLLKKERTAMLDEITGLYNRRYFERILIKEYENTKRYEQPLSILLFRLNNIDQLVVDDSHKSRGEVLAKLAAVFTQYARQTDHAIRYDDQEFAIILPRSNKEQTELAYERYRNILKESINRKPDARLRYYKISLGSASIPEDVQDIDMLVKKARDSYKPVS